MDATSFGNHEFDYGVACLQQQIAQAHFPILGVNNVDSVTGQPPSWVKTSTVFLNGFTPACDPNFTGGTGRFPQVSGLKVTYTCKGITPMVTEMWKATQGVNGPLTPIGPADPVRIVTNDFMYGGGDGYTVFRQGTNVLNPGNDLLEIAVNYVAANSPVAPVVEGRIVRTP